MNEEQMEPLALDEAVELMPDEPAAADAAESPADESIVLEEEKKLSEPVAVMEETDLRAENMKVFNMSDGSRQAVFFAEPVHTFDEEEQRFVDINNTLVEDEDGRHYRNTQNHFTALFSKEVDTDELFSVEKGAHKLTVSMFKNATSKNSCVAPKLMEMQTADMDENPAAVTKLTFEDVVANADFEYEVSGDRVKENIVIKEKSASYRYSFNINCDNLQMQFSEDERVVSFHSTESDAEIFSIPAPFMTDANGVHSDGVFYEVINNADGRISLSMIADSEWINAEDRAFPVTIDPQVVVSGSSTFTTYSWYNNSMYSASTHTIGTAGSCNARRMYLNLVMPSLPRNPRIKKAELTITQQSGTQCGCNSRIGLYKVTQPICTGTCTPAYDANLLDYEVVKCGCTPYTFDITALIDSINKGETTYPNLMFKMVDETCQTSDSVIWYGSTSGSNAPKLTITYETSYGVLTSSRTNTHEIGRFGTVGIDLQNGNLMFDSEDFAWGGKRMPVTIKHYFNSALSGYFYTANSSIGLNTADFSSMKIGQGWKLNVMQSMLSKTFMHEGVSYSGYVYIGETGEEIYLKQGTTDKLKRCCYPNGQCCTYYLFEDIYGKGYTYDANKKELYSGDDTYLFDSVGRLIKISDKYNNSRNFTYTSGKLTSVIDGAGRVFAFNYSAGGQLTSITAPDNTGIGYAYTNDRLTQITYPNGRIANITYSATSPYQPTEVLLTDGAATNLYKTTYSYDSFGRVFEVKEYTFTNGTPVLGQSSAYTYSVAARKTTVTTTEQADGTDAANVITTVYSFDNDGNVLDHYLYTVDTGNVGVGSGDNKDGGNNGSGINPYAGNGGASVVSNINNLLLSHNFDDRVYWTNAPSNCSDFIVQSNEYQSYALFGSWILRMQSNCTNARENGVYQVSDTLPAGKYTFSVYLRLLSNAVGDDTVPNPGAYIKVKKTDGTLLAQSERIVNYDSEYIRLIAPFELTSAMSVQVGIYIDGRTTVYADGAQLENNVYANAYNMLINGNFEKNLTGWCNTDNVASVTDTRFNMSKSMRILGTITAAKYAYQTVNVKAYTDVRETFTLSGWAKGYGITDRARSDASTNALFRLRARITYSDGTFEDNLAEFSPCSEEWQLASVQFAKKNFKTVSNITVFCEYSFNVGYAYFDDIQLTRDKIESGLTADDFKVATDSSGDQELSDTTTDDSTKFVEAKDAFGNDLTGTKFKDGEFGTIYSSFTYSNNGNDLSAEIDSNVHSTKYSVNADTSRNQTVTDRLQNKTEYVYDNSGRMTSLTAKDSSNVQLANVSYTYDAFNNLTGITRGDGMNYSLTYNNFHNLESIGIPGLSPALIQYTYKNGNGRLKQMSYANGDTMFAAYNSIGQMVSETWKNAGQAEIAKYKYVYDGSGNIVRSIDILLSKEYNYSYESGRIARSTENNITVDANGIVTSKVLVNTVFYTYNSDGKVTKKRIQDANGNENTYTFDYPEDAGTVTKLPTGVTAHSKTDHLGRKEFDELQLGTGFLSRKFTYQTGKLADENGIPTANACQGKLKSSPTTSLVKTITFANGRTLSYEYDVEEHITKVTDSIEGDTVYTYDALGQLTSETKGGVTTSFTYDNYGNIQSKGTNTYTYTYEEPNNTDPWRDKLTHYNGVKIDYDAGGNPLSYRGYTFSWEKGRQLKSAVGNGYTIAYTYNANGIRTSKSVNGTRHDYVIDGTKILRETFSSTVLDFLYDNEDSICGLKYNGVPYYFYKNLQGDIIEITDASGATVVRYTYDAWGSVLATTGALSSTVGAANPFRYRGYYFDSDVSFYYLQSRYYDSVVGRWLNADESGILGVSGTVLSYNLYTYCDNEPVKGKDVNGQFATVIVMAIGAIFGLFVQYVVDMLSNLIVGAKNIFKPISSIWDYITAGLCGALAATGIGKMASAFMGGILSTINYVANCAAKKNKFNALGLILTVVIGIVGGLIGGAGADLKRVSGVVNFSNKVLKTAVSPKKIAMYLSTIKKAVINTIVSTIRYILAAVAGVLGGAGRNFILGLI